MVANERGLSLLRVAVVDFVAAHGHATQAGPGAMNRPKPGLRVAHCLIQLKHGHQRQQAQAWRIAVNAVWVDQGLA